MKNALLFAVFILAGCQTHHSKKDITAMPALEEQDVAFTEVLKEELVFFDSNRKLKSQQRPSDHAQDRKIIRQGWLHFQTADPSRARARVAELCEELNAYVAQEDQHDRGSGISYEQTIRIPSPAFDEFIRRTEELSGKTEKRNITSRDVTEEFIDLKSRIANQKSLEKRYLMLLEKGKHVDELLAIEKELARVRTEIETMEGKMNFLENQVSFCTLHLLYYENTVSGIAIGPRLRYAFNLGYESLVMLFLGIITIWPFVILIALAIMIYVRYKKKRAPESPA